MSTQSNRIPREVVDFPANVPVTVGLKYAHGKTISTQHGERFMFSLDDGRVMFLDPEVAGQIASLGINVRENFSITRKCEGPNGSVVSWEVARVTGEQPNGTLVVPAVPPKMPASASASHGGIQYQGARTLIEESKSLVDVFAAVWEYTRETYRGQVKPEEVRSFVNTAYIQRGRCAAA
jgi:hypothetical protein